MTNACSAKAGRTGIERPLTHNDNFDPCVLAAAVPLRDGHARRSYIQYLLWLACKAKLSAAVGGSK